MGPQVLQTRSTMKSRGGFSRTGRSIDLQNSFVGFRESGVLLVGKILPFPLLLRHRREPAPEFGDGLPFVQYRRTHVLWCAHCGKVTTHD